MLYYCLSQVILRLLSVVLDCVSFVSDIFGTIYRQVVPSRGALALWYIVRVVAINSSLRVSFHRDDLYHVVNKGANTRKRTKTVAQQTVVVVIRTRMCTELSDSCPVISLPTEQTGEQPAQLQLPDMITQQ